VPQAAALRVQAVAEDIRPSANDLQVDSLLVEPLEAVDGWFDQAREERAHLEAVVEMYCGWCRLRPYQPDADLCAAGCDGIDELGRYVMCMGVDRHLRTPYVMVGGGDEPVLGRGDAAT
jgi:hypothetical protein